MRQLRDSQSDGDSGRLIIASSTNVLLHRVGLLASYKQFASSCISFPKLVELMVCLFHVPEQKQNLVLLYAIEIHSPCHNCLQMYHGMVFHWAS